MKQTSRLIDAVLRRPVAATMAFVLSLALGIIAYRSIPVALFPRGYQFPSLWIQIPVPGGTPPEIEQSVSIPAEESLRTIPSIQRVLSISQPDRASMTIDFGNNVDMDLAYAEVKDRLERARASWPETVDDYFVFRFNTNTDLPIQWFAVLYDKDSMDPAYLAEKLIQPRLESEDGVARVQVEGLQQESLRIALSRPRLEAARIDLFSLVNQLRDQHFSLPSGSLKSDDEGYLVRVDARIRAVDEIGELPVGERMRLKDLATEIGPHRDTRSSVSRVNGRQCLVFAVSKNSTANTVAVCTRIEEAMEDLRNDPRMKGTEIFSFFSQKEAILGALGGVKQSAIYGGILAILILNLFLRRLRLTLAVALAIPSSVLMALVVLYFMGRTFNIFSLAGFTLAVGMLVDNAIVVIENISRWRQQGKSPFEASSLGTGEVALAVTMATLTTLIVFVPLVFLSSDQNIRLLLSEVAGPISFSLLASLVSALVFLPILAMRFLKNPRTSRAGASDVPRLARVIARPLAWVLEHRLAAVLGSVLLLQSVGVASHFMQKGLGDGGGGGNEVSVHLEFQTGFNMADANAAVQRIEEFLEARREELNIETVVASFQRRSGQISVYLEDGTDASIAMALPETLRQQLPVQAGVRYRIGRETGSGERRDIRLEITGRDTGRLAEIADDLVLLLDTKPHLTNVRSDIERGTDEVRVELDREAARRNDIGIDAFRGAVSWGLGGIEVAEIDLNGRDVPVIVEYENSEDQSLRDLRNIGISSPAGEKIPLTHLANIDVVRGPGAIVRSNGRTVVGITVTPASENSLTVQREIREAMEAYPFPPGYAWQEGDGFQEFENSFRETMIAFAMAVVLVYLLMGVLFESFFLPLSVLLSIPFAVLGAYWMLAITRVPLDAVGMVGFIILAGIVVNNAIVLVDQINRNRLAGAARTEAILKASEVRLRPILMTALTTICGLIPMAMPGLFGTSGGLFSYQALAVCVLGGLTLSTFLTLFIVPLYYTLFDDLGGWLRGAFWRVMPARFRRELATH